MLYKVWSPHFFARVCWGRMTCVMIWILTRVNCYTAVTQTCVRTRHLVKQLVRDIVTSVVSVCPVW